MVTGRCAISHELFSQGNAYRLPKQITLLSTKLATAEEGKAHAQTWSCSSCPQKYAKASCNDCILCYIDFVDSCLLLDKNFKNYWFM